MNCISCNAPLKPGAKFCSRCGAKQQQMPVQTGNLMKEDSVSAQSAANMPSVSMVKGKINWNVAPHEIVRRINEVEFLQYESALGIIVNDGTSAYIKANGQLIMVLNGGCYDFIEPEELENALETEICGLWPGLKKKWDAVVRFVLGEKLKDKINQSNRKDLEKTSSIEEVVSFLKRGIAFSVTLKQNRDFELTVGLMHDDLDDFVDFKPMLVRTRLHDVQLGVRALFAITDFDEFTAYYLGENSSVYTNMLAKDFTPQIKAVLQRCLADEELNGVNIPEDVFRQIELHLKALNLHGVTLKRLVEIAVSNEDLERMRELSCQMYLSEQELDYLKRTNDYKNRLSVVTNQQRLTEARTDLDLYKQLQDINRDKLLADDELDKFYTVLSREKRIRDAKNRLEEDQARNVIEAAYADIAKTGLLREEEIEIMKFEIEKRSYERGFAVKLMQLKDAVEYEKARVGGTHEVELLELAHKLGMIREQDRYEDEKFYRELQKSKNVHKVEMDAIRERMELQHEHERFAFDLAEQGMRNQMERLKEMEQLEMESEDRASERRRLERQQEIEHEEKIRSEREITERQRIDAQRTMSYEQILASKDNLDAAAQVELARSVSAGKDAVRECEVADEKLSQMREFMAQLDLERQRSADERREKDDNTAKLMMEMMRNMSAMSNNMVQNRNEQREEYRQELHREQERHDIHQDRALNYTTRHLQGNVQQGQPVTNQQQATQQVQSVVQQPKAERKTEVKECPCCHRVYEKDMRFCEECGTEL